MHEYSAGRLVNTSFREVDPTHCVVDMEDVGSFNHIVVFLTGQTPFPEGTGGAVYFSWPDSESGGATPWQFLGMISNQKPSAIFKVAKFKPQAVSEQSISAKFQFQMQQNQINSVRNLVFLDTARCFFLLIFDKSPI